MDTPMLVKGAEKEFRDGVVGLLDLVENDDRAGLLLQQLDELALALTQGKTHTHTHTHAKRERKRANQVNVFSTER